MFVALVSPYLQRALDEHEKHGISATSDSIDLAQHRLSLNLEEEPPPNQPPTVWMTASPLPARGPSPLTINFAAYAADPDGFIASYSWDFGDGQTSSQVSVSHTYLVPGDYTVRITVADGAGATASYAAIVTVLTGTNQPPHVSLTASPTMGHAPLTVNFSAAASDPDGQVVSYNWDFGDGMTSSQVAPSHTYQSIGDYTVSVTVADNFGATATATTVVSATGADVVNQPPRVNVTASPLAGHAPLTVNFVATATDPDGQVVAYNWTFGDGATSTMSSPSHTYQSTGSYTSRVTVTDNIGATATASIVINVMEQPPPPIQDADGDGLPDTLENQLANMFVPAYFVSAGEQTGTGLATFQDRSDQQVVQQVFPTSPATVITYYRVLPLGFSGQNGYIQLDYLTLWNRDDGLNIGGDCEFFLDLLAGLAGFDALRVIQALSPHAIDNERSITRLVAPKVAGSYNPDFSAYRSDFLYTVAHEDKINQIETLVQFTPPASPPFHLPLALARSKHSTYPFNPDHLPLLPEFIVLAIYFAIDAYCAYGDPVTCILLNLIADTVVFSCIVERFEDQGGTLPQMQINVGEPSLPLNGSHFIQTMELANKLQKRFRIP